MYYKNPLCIFIYYFYIAKLSLLNSSSYYQHFYPHLLLTLCKFQFCFFIYSTITENLVAPLQEKMEEWKRNVAQMDKDHAKGIKLFFFFINTCYILFSLYSLFKDIPLLLYFIPLGQVVKQYLRKLLLQVLVRNTRGSMIMNMSNGVSV